MKVVDFKDEQGQPTRACVGEREILSPLHSLTEWEAYAIVFTDYDRPDPKGKPNFDLGLLLKVNDADEWKITRAFTLKGKGSKYRYKNLETAKGAPHLASPDLVSYLDDALNEFREDALRDDALNELPEER